MSFMFKPLAYDDPNAVNYIKLDDRIKDALVSGNENVIAAIVEECPKHGVLLVEGYISAQFDDIAAMIRRYCKGHGISSNLISMDSIYKTQAEIDEVTAESLPLNYDEDPVLLFGRLYKGEMEDLIDPEKLSALQETLKERKAELTVVYGTGSSIKPIRSLADRTAYVDVTPKVAAIRAREKKLSLIHI